MPNFNFGRVAGKEQVGHKAKISVDKTSYVQLLIVAESKEVSAIFKTVFSVGKRCERRYVRLNPFGFHVYKLMFCLLTFS